MMILNHRTRAEICKIEGKQREKTIPIKRKNKNRRKIRAYNEVKHIQKKQYPLT